MNAWTRGWGRAGVFGGLMVSLLLGGCGDSITGPLAPEDVTFNPALGIDLAQFTRLPSGVYIRTVEAGSGEATQRGDRVTVGYEVRLPDNTLVDSSPPAISWTLAGTPDIIVGFDIGVTGMRVGEDRRIIIPSNLAYGAQGRGAVPPNSVLIFDVTLISVG